MLISVHFIKFERYPSLKTYSGKERNESEEGRRMRDRIVEKERLLMPPSFFLPNKQKHPVFQFLVLFLRTLFSFSVFNNHEECKRISPTLFPRSLFRPSPSFSGVAELLAGEGEPGGEFRGGTTGVSLSRLSPVFLVAHGRRGERTRARFCGVAGERESSEERGEGVRKVSLKLLQSLGSARSLSRSR